jgi:hypothetical protein
MILLIFAFWVARITSVSHGCPASSDFLNKTRITCSSELKFASKMSLIYLLASPHFCYSSRFHGHWSSLTRKKDILSPSLLIKADPQSFRRPLPKPPPPTSPC